MAVGDLPSHVTARFHHSCGPCSGEVRSDNQFKFTFIRSASWTKYPVMSRCNIFGMQYAALKAQQRIKQTICS